MSSPATEHPFESAAAETEQAPSRGDVAHEPADFVRQFEICREFGISDETWRRWVRSHVAPQPVDLPGRPRWRRADIERFKRGRAEAVAGRRVSFGSAVRWRHG